MSIEVMESSAEEPLPTVSTRRGVEPISDIERRLHAPDRQLLAVDNGTLVGRCSCWWSGVGELKGERAGAIGHYAAVDARSAGALLSRACDVLEHAGCTIAVGPLDGNTWRRYRFVVERGPEPPFFLEPDNPDEWPPQWSEAGFSPLAFYTSAVNDDLTREDPRTDAALRRLSERDVRIRSFDLNHADAELRRIFGLSLAGFSRNFMYSPISETEFMVQNNAVLPFVRPELVLIAETSERVVGFVLGLPDVLEPKRGTPETTVIVKTVAVDPEFAGVGLGGALVDLLQRSARKLGFRRAIHALMHEQNLSRAISSRYARPIRRYALFARPLVAR